MRTFAVKWNRGTPASPLNRLVGPQSSIFNKQTCIHYLIDTINHKNWITSLNCNNNYSILCSNKSTHPHSRIANYMLTLMSLAIQCMKKIAASLLYILLCFSTNKFQLFLKCKFLHSDSEKTAHQFGVDLMIPFFKQFHLFNCRD